MKPVLFAVSALALGLAACSEPENPAAVATTEPGVAPASAPNDVQPQVESGVQAYVEKAALGDMFEVEASKVALERTKVQAVKDYAQMMVDGHTATSAEMKPLASAAGVQPPTALDEAHLKKIADLRDASEADFDDKYIDIMTEAHENALDLNQDFAKNGKDAGLMAFAGKTAPTIEAHLTQVKALDDGSADDITEDNKS
jgi:putative membrane protein